MTDYERRMERPSNDPRQKCQTHNAVLSGQNGTDCVCCEAGGVFSNENVYADFERWCKDTPSHYDMIEALIRDPAGCIARWHRDCAIELVEAARQPYREPLIRPMSHQEKE